MKKKKYDFKTLEGLEKLFNDSVEEMAQEVLIKIEYMYETAIDLFYADYNPLYYNRTYSTYEGSSGAKDLFSPQNIYGSDNNWTAGIIVDPSFINNKPYRADTDWVFERTFVKGIHGINTGKAWGKKTSKTFVRVKGKEKYRTYSVMLTPHEGKNGWSANKQTTINKFYDESAEVMYRTMSNMIPTPKALVSKGFKALTKKKNMKKMFNEILNSKLH